MSSRLRGFNFVQAVLFSVPFQGTLFSVNGSLKVVYIPAVKTDRLLDYRRISILPSTARRPACSRAGKHDFWEKFLVRSLLKDKQQQSNDRKEALATKALQAVVNKIDQFDRRNISRYLRCYVREMELNRVSEKKMVALFGLATIPEIRDHITSITDRCGNSWEDFSHALKDEYFLGDADRVTKKLFLEWIERPNKHLQYSQLSKVEKLTLEPNKVDLFLQAADGELQGKLELLLEDKEEDEGLTTKWKNVEDAVGLLTKKERKKDRSNILKTIQAPKAPVRTTPPTMPTVQPSTSLSKKADMGQPYITAIRMETKVLDDGSAYARVRSEDGRKAVQFLTVPPNHERNRDRLREKPLSKIVEGFKDFGEIGTLQDDERILGVYEENGLEDSLELITSIGLGDNDKVVEIHSREVYTMLESFQAPEVTVETRYKSADKKVKPVAGPLPVDSKEQMGEASKEASLRDPMSIGHHFTKETFEELKIGSDGSLLSEEITCFKKMLAKQGRSFAFESHEIGCVDPNIITPMVIFAVPHVP
uniref:Predicted protein n=1 Tax=Physcomitrium patens TaxID=3218 RepID=A9U4L9_PHYPA